MGKKHRKRKKASKQRITRRSTSHPTGFEYRQMSSPFEGMSETEVSEQIRAMGDEFGREFEDSFQKLQKRLLAVDPVLLLSSLAFYGLTVPVGKDPELTEEHPILQHHVELLQGLALQHPREAFESKPVLPPDFEVFRDLTERVTRAFHMRRFAVLEPSMPLELRQRLRVLDSTRVHTQAVRNWGYPQQVTRITTELFAPLEDDIEQQVGVRVAHLIRMCVKLIAIAEKRMNAHRNLLRPMVRAKSITSAVEKYHRSFPDLKSTSEEFLQFAKEQNASLRGVQAMLVSHSDLRLPDIYTFTLADFVNAYPVAVEPDTLRPVLDSWVLSFGDLADQNPEHLFMGNPIWRQPLIRLGDDLFLWPILGLFFSFGLELMERVLQPNTELYAKYEKRRAKFLEDELEQIFRSTFPSAEVYRSSQWHDPVTYKDFENDLLILIDSYLIVIEAKSGKITEPARRGAELRLERTVDELMIAPSLQAKRFAEYLQNNPGIHRFPTRQGVTNEIDTSNIYEVICLNITLNLLGGLSSRWPDLRQAGLIPQGIDLAPTMSLAELEIIFEILEGTCEKLHYLVRRAQFEVHANYIGDEIDLLAFYIDTGFNIGEAEFDHTGLFLRDMSKAFDPYFLCQWSGEDAPKPRRRLTRWWMDILHQIEQRQVTGWTELGYILLNVAYDDQVEFEKGFKRIQRIVQHHWQKPGHENLAVLFNGPPQRRDVIAGLAYKRITREQRNQWIENGAGDAMESAPANRSLVIGIDVERRDYPYSVIACMVKRKKA